MSTSLIAIALLSAPPNLVLVIADDCTKGDLGVYGGQAATPNLDRLAAEGMTFNACFQAAPMCSPTRHNLYTGLYPVRSGAYPNHTFVRPGVKSVVPYLRPAGYRLALSGKRHVNPQSVFDFEYSGRDNNPDMEAVDRLMAECAASDTPLCLFACSNEPHTPWDKGDASAYDPASLTLPPTWVDTPRTRSDYAKYLAEVTYFDSQVGRITELLKKHGLTGDTLFVVLSEQGSSFPLAKWTLYDAGIGSGMIVRWPGRVAAGSESDALVEYVDILPTFLEAAGVAVPDVLEGRSLLPVLTGETDCHKEHVYAIQTSRGINDGPDHYGRRSVRDARYKLIHNLSPEATFRGAVTTQPLFAEWRAAAETDPRTAMLVEKVTSPPEWELFDTRADPFELTNLAGSPELASVEAGLRDKLAAWMKSQGDEGHATEMRALERMRRGRRKRR